MRIIIFILSAFACNPYLSYAQTGNEDTVAQKQSFLQSFNKISGRSLHFIDRKYSSLANAVNRQTLRLLQRMQRREQRLKQKVWEKDSSRAKQLFANSEAGYQKLQAKLQSAANPAVANPLKEYVPGLDSTATAFRFLQQNAANAPGADPGKLQQIQQVNAQIQQLQGQMQNANEAQQFVRDREQQLKSQLSGYGVGNELLGMNKQVFYYRQQLEEYKSIINNKEKLEETVLEKLNDLPAFRDFMSKNSYVAQLFSLPGNYGDPASLAGLQTRDQVAQMVSQRVGGAAVGANASPSQYFQPQIDQAQGQLNNIKNLLNRFGGNSGTLVNPGFKPNSQKTKTLLDRLVYGITVQTKQPTSLTPALSIMRFTVGYKLNDESTLGIGGSYLLGLGRGINNIRFSNEGAGLTSYIDLKIKGNIWFSGGYEANYMQAFQKFADLYKVTAWQQSALFGLAKKIKLGSKKESDMQLLFDALYKQHIPQTQPVIFRFGYSFN